jgi:uncharacterized membrane protein
MKRLNYIMSAGFGIMAVVCILAALDVHRWDWAFVAGICFLLAFVAWQDYRNEPEQ